MFSVQYWDTVTTPSYSQSINLRQHQSCSSNQWPHVWSWNPTPDKEVSFLTTHTTNHKDRAFRLFNISNKMFSLTSNKSPDQELYSQYMSINVLQHSSQPGELGVKCWWVIVAKYDYNLPHPAPSRSDQARKSQWGRLRPSGGFSSLSHTGPLPHSPSPREGWRLITRTFYLRVNESTESCVVIKTRSPQ